MKTVKELLHYLAGVVQVEGDRVVVLDEVSLGGITLNRVRASINPNMPQGEVLLGMSFLKHVEFSQRGDTLTIRQ